MGVYGFVRLLLPLFPNEIKILGPWLLGLAVCSIVFASLAAWAQSDLKRMVAYLSINHLGYCMLGLFAVTATTAGSVDRNAGGVERRLHANLQPRHHRGGAVLLRRIARATARPRADSNDFGGLMQRTPLLCGWMSVAMFSSLGLPGLNGFIGEFLIFKGSFALAAWLHRGRRARSARHRDRFHARDASALQRTARGELRRISRSPPEREVGRRSGHAAHVRPRHRARSSSSTSSTPPSCRWRGCLADL